MVISDMMLQRGMDFITSNDIIVKHPTLEEIDKLGEDKYAQIVNIFTARPYDFMVELEDSGVNYLSLTNYDLFLELISNDMEMNYKLFLRDINELTPMINTSNDEIVLYDKQNDVIIDRMIYEEISNFIRRINMIQQKPPHTPNTQMMKQMLIDDMRAKRERSKYERKILKQSELSNLIRFVVWNNQAGYNYDNIWSLKIYQLYEGLISLQKTDNYKNTMLGLYTGNVDGSKINFEEISWSSRIKIT